MHAHMHMHKHACTPAHAHMYKLMHACTHTHAHTHTHARAHTYTLTHTHTHTHARTHNPTPLITPCSSCGRPPSLRLPSHRLTCSGLPSFRLVHPHLQWSTLTCSGPPSLVVVVAPSSGGGWGAHRASGLRHRGGEGGEMGGSRPKPHCACMCAGMRVHVGGGCRGALTHCGLRC